MNPRVAMRAPELQVGVEGGKKEHEE